MAVAPSRKALTPLVAVVEAAVEEGGFRVLGSRAVDVVSELEAFAELVEVFHWLAAILSRETPYAITPGKMSYQV